MALDLLALAAGRLVHALGDQGVGVLAEQVLEGGGLGQAARDLLAQLEHALALGDDLAEAFALAGRGALGRGGVGRAQVGQRRLDRLALLPRTCGGWPR